MRPGGKLFAQLDCGLLAASRGSSKAAKSKSGAAAGRVGVVCVPTVADLSGAAAAAKPGVVDDPEEADAVRARPTKGGEHLAGPP